MLQQLHIRDLAVIEEVTVEFGAGFTALTGETGAGKSILIDALALALGERGDALAIRSGASRLEVNAAFSLDDNAAARSWLEVNDLGADSDCILRRVIGADGRSRAWINGTPVAVQTLRDFGAHLVDICGQQDYQSLRHRAVQRDLLDALAGHDGLRAALREAYRGWQAAREAHERLLEAQRDRTRREELLRFQVNELSALAPREGEVPALEQEHRALSHRARIVEALNLALTRAYDDEDASASSLAVAASRALDDVLGFDAEVEAPLKLLRDAEIQIAEAAALLRQRLERLDPDPDRENAVADRLAALQEMARKHRVPADALPEVADRLEEELGQLTNAEEALQALERASSERHAEALDLARRLRAGRVAAGKRLEEAVTRGMSKLGMAGGRFQASIEPLGDERLGPDGSDEVEFLVTTNAGQSAGPLRRIASGGELSRLNLAIQVVATAASGAPTLVFDEVDAGVGGAVAEIVGRQLRELGDRRQVLCITHLPQVATLAAQQVSVRKSTRKGETATHVSVLPDEERVEEIARMLGGVQITEQTRAHAREMLEAGKARVPERGASRRSAEGRRPRRAPG